MFNILCIQFDKIHCKRGLQQWQLSQDCTTGVYLFLFLVYGLGSRIASNKFRRFGGCTTYMSLYYDLSVKPFKIQVYTLKLADDLIMGIRSQLI